MLIKKDTLHAIVSATRIIKVSGLVVVEFEPDEIDMIRQIGSFDVDGIEQLIDHLKVPVSVWRVIIHSFHVEQLQADPWPHLSATLSVKTFEEVRIAPEIVTEKKEK